MNDIPNVDPTYTPRYAGRRGERRRDTIFVTTKPGETRPAPKPVPEGQRVWRPSEFKF